MTLHQSYDKSMNQLIQSSHVFILLYLAPFSNDFTDAQFY